MQLKMFNYFPLKVSFMILICDIYWNKFVSESNCHKRTSIDNLLFTFKNITLYCYCPILFKNI